MAGKYKDPLTSQKVYFSYVQSAESSHTASNEAKTALMTSSKVHGSQK